VPPAVELLDLGVTYGDRPILEHITLRVEMGDFLGLIGPNGAGKSTLIKLIVGLVPPSYGTVQAFGEAVWRIRNGHSPVGVGYVPQHTALEGQNLPATVSEVVSTGRISGRTILRRFDEHDHQKVADALDVVGIADLRLRKIRELSGGEFQRMLIARALAGDPRLMILDEPTASIDVGSQTTFYALLERLNRERGLTILLASHDIGAVSRSCTKVACLNRRLYFHGDAGDFLESEVLSRVYGYPVELVSHEKHPA
jgi:zinc transport system ATP-binding protein